MLRFFNCLALSALCAGFTISSKQKLSPTALFYGLDEKGNYFDDFGQDPSDESFLHSSEHTQNEIFNEKSMDNDWRAFRAKLVAGENVVETSSVVEEDPLAEPPILDDSKTPIPLNHQWAHPIDHIETGCLLIANENMGGIFYGKVLLVIDHCWEGTTAVVINSIFPGGLAEVSTNQGSYLDDKLLHAFPKTDVAYGGNMRMGEYSLLHGFGEVDGAQKIAPGVFFGGENALVSEVMHGHLDPRNALFVKGKCMWYPGRLEAEIQSGKWYVASASSDFLLRNAGARKQGAPNDLWKDILKCMGGYYADIADKYAGNLKP